MAQCAYSSLHACLQCFEMHTCMSSCQPCMPECPIQPCLTRAGSCYQLLCYCRYAVSCRSSLHHQPKDTGGFLGWPPNSPWPPSKPFHAALGLAIRPVAPDATATDILPSRHPPAFMPSLQVIGSILGVVSMLSGGPWHLWGLSLPRMGLLLNTGRLYW